MTSSSELPARLGKYILLEKLNTGGMAEIYLAKVTGAEQFERFVAVKCMLPSLLEDEQFTSMFIDEAKIASQLNHANIVHIYELGKLSNRLYIAMELVNGRDLRHILRTAAKKNALISVEWAAYVIAKAAEGLDYAHKKTTSDGKPMNLVHRDVSPQNILIGFDGQVKVADFGIAKAQVRNTETQSGVLKGKFGYMAPEQITGQPVDRRVDIFALGICLYEMLAGKRLFTADNDLALLEQVRNCMLPDLNQELPDCSLDLKNVILKALQKNPEDRYQYASEMSEALETILISEKNIYGAKKASKFMETLFLDEIENFKKIEKKYAHLNDDAVHSVFAQEVKNDMSFDIDMSGFGHGNTVILDQHTRIEDMNSSKSQKISEATSGKIILPTSASMSNSVSVPSPIAESHVIRTVYLAIGSVVVLMFLMGGFLFYKLKPQASSSVILPDGPDPHLLAKQPSVVAQPDLGALPSSPQVLNNGVSNSIVSNTVLEGASNQIVSNHAQNVDDVSKNDTEKNTESLSQTSHVSVKKQAAKKEDDEEQPVRDSGFGFVSVKANGVGGAKIYIDGEEAGFSPLLLYRLSVGKHEVMVEEQVDGEAGRTKIFEVVITGRHTRKTPSRLIVPF